MHKLSIKQRHAVWQKRVLYLFLSFLVLISLTTVVTQLTTTGQASAATDNSLNFQGRLLTNTGGLVPDGTYNIEFNLYTVDTGGISEWTETRLNSAAQGVTVRNGYYSAYLGDVTAFPASINWDQELWLGMTVRGSGSCAFAACTPTDAEMTPRFELTAVPYAFRAGAVIDSAGNAYTGDDLVQLAPSTFQALNAAESAIRLNQAGSGGLLELLGDGLPVFTVDKTGATTLASGLTLGASTSITAGTIRWSGTDFEGFDGVTWESLTAGGGGGGPQSVTLIQVVDGAGGTNVNTVVATPVPWNTETKKDTGFQHSNVTNNSRVIIDDPGWYRVTYTVSAQTTSNVRTNVQCQVRLNGATIVTNSSSYTYTRQLGDPNASNTASVYIETTAANEYYEVVCQRSGSAGTTATIAGQSWTIAEKTVDAGSSSNAFVQGGNDFGATAVLGTTGADSLELVTNGSTAIAIDSTGAATFSNGLTVVSGDIALQGGDITSNAGLTVSSGGSGSLVLDSASDVLVIEDSIIRRTAAGVTTIDLLNASGNTTLSITNSDGTRTAGLSVEGSVSAASFTGAGAGLTGLNASSIVSGTINDLRLSSNVALLNGSGNAFINNTTFLGGLTLGNSALTNAGNIRFTGTDFEGYDGAGWVSLTSGGGSGGAGASVIKTVDESISTTVTLQNDDELLFPVGDNQTWTFEFVVQAQSGTAPDIQFAVTAPVGSTCLYGFEDAQGSASGSQFGCGTTTGRVDGTGQDEVYRISGTVTTSTTAGDVRLQWSQATSNAATTTVYAGSYVIANEENGGSGGLGGGGLSFVQNGNDFGATAILGTTDAFGLNVVTNGSNALTFTSTGLATFVNDLTVNGGLSIDGNVTSINGLELSSGTFSDLTLSSASGTIVLGANTLQRTAAGTTTLDLLDAGADTTFSITNSDVTRAANLVVEGSISGADIISSGSVSAVSFTGQGSGLTDLNGSEITSGTIPDARLSSNIVRLDTAQSFSAVQTFSQGAVIGNSISTTAGAVRFTGTDFEGYNGTEWVSLTDSGADIVTVIKTADETVNNSNVLQDDDELVFDVDANQVWTVDFVLQAQSGTTPDFRYAVTAPAGSTCTVGFENPENAQSQSQVGCGVSTSRVAGSGNNEIYRIVGTVSTGSFAGQIRLQWAQFTTNASNTIVRAGSYVRAVEENGASGGGGGGGGGGLEFIQNGNAFGAAANLGTTDAFGLNFYTDGSLAVGIDALGDVIFSNAVDVNGLLSANNGLTITSGSLDLSTNGVSNTGAIAGATTINASGTATVGGLTTTGTVAAGTITVDDLIAANAIVAPTTGNTINGLVINGGALDSISGYNQTSGNFTLNGTGTLTTGVGDVIFNGDVTAATTLGVNDGLTINGTDIGSNSRFYVEDAITVGTGIITGPGISNTYTFDADNDTDELAWTFVSDNGGNGLNPANTTRAWSWDNNDTVSANVGPTSGQEGAPDGYVHTEASAPSAFNDTFSVAYNTILDAAASNWVVEFYWNQRGNDNTATLDLQTNEASAGWVTRASYGGGDQGTGAAQVWNFESFDLTSVVSDASTEIRFLVTFPASGTVWHNDFGLDTITVREDTAFDSFVYSSNLIEGYNASATANVDLLSLRSDVGSVENVVFRVDSDGDVFSDGVNNIAGGADIAENYLNSDGAGAGDVVYFTDNRTVAKTTEQGQAALAGVVSTNAGVILDADVEGVPVGLKGRLPTKVSIANGVIKRGDYLTSGPDGRAVKAVSNGTAIGIAMEQIETDGVIDVFVGLTYYVAGTGDSIPAGGLTFVDGSDDTTNPVESEGSTCLSGGCGYLVIASTTTLEDSSLQDTININKTGESGNLIVLKRDSVAVFTVANTGSLEIRSSSSNALDIRNIGGASFLRVDTVTGLTTITELTVTGSLSGAGLTDCRGEYDTLQWDATSGLFRCRSLAPQLAQLVASTGVLGVTIGTDIAIPFDSQTRITDGFIHDATAQTNTKLTVVDSGWYKIDYSVTSTSQGEGSLTCNIRINGVDEASQSQSSGYQVTSIERSINTKQVLLELSASDYVEVVCQQNSALVTSDIIPEESWIIIEKR